jgi:hypothetical protein
MRKNASNEAGNALGFIPFLLICIYCKCYVNKEHNHIPDEEHVKRLTMILIPMLLFALPNFLNK